MAHGIAGSADKRCSTSPIIDNETIAHEVEKELNVSMKSFNMHKNIDEASLVPFIDDETKRKEVLKIISARCESIIGTAEAVLREKVLQEVSFRFKYGVVRDDRRDLRNQMIQLESLNDVLQAKLNIRPSLEELERMVIPAWLLNSELSYKTMWIVSIDFKLTPNAAILSKRIEDSKNLTTDIMAEAMIKLYNKSSRKISHNDNPESIVLDEMEWKILFHDVEISNNLQQQAVKLALKPVFNCETNLKRETLDQDNKNFVVYISDIGNSFNLKRCGEKKVAKKIVETCGIMEFIKHCRQYHFPKNQGGKYTFEAFLVVVNISAATIEAWETNLEQGLPDDSIVRSEKAELFF